MEVIFQIIDYLDKITICFAFVTMCIAIYGLRQYRKMQQPIEINIVRGGKSRHLITVQRKSVTRAEILGILGMFDLDSKFKIRYTTLPDFYRLIQDVQMGRKNEISIPIEEDDEFHIKGENTTNSENRTEPDGQE